MFPHIGDSRYDGAFPILLECVFLADHVVRIRVVAADFVFVEKCCSDGQKSHHLHEPDFIFDVPFAL